MRNGRSVQSPGMWGDDEIRQFGAQDVATVEGVTPNTCLRVYKSDKVLDYVMGGSVCHDPAQVPRLLFQLV